jgi:hypothetical protein
MSRQRHVSNLINFEVNIELMGNKNWIIFGVLITFISIFTPIITFAQWPITADPSMAEDGLDDLSDDKNNHTLLSNHSAMHLNNPP